MIFEEPIQFTVVHNGDSLGQKGIYYLDAHRTLRSFKDAFAFGQTYGNDKIKSLKNPCYEYFFGQDCLEQAEKRLKELRGVFKCKEKNL